MPSNDPESANLSMSGRKREEFGVVAEQMIELAAMNREIAFVLGIDWEVFLKLVPHLLLIYHRNGSQLTYIAP